MLPYFSEKDYLFTLKDNKIVKLKQNSLIQKCEYRHLHIHDIET